MKLNNIMPLLFATVFLAIAIFTNGNEFFFLGGAFFFIAVYWVIKAIENININNNE